ncbi:MAG: alanine--tRNA ligase [Minisyncoccales bacterium]
MDSKKLRQKFLDFFEKRGHKIVPSSSLLPSDSTVLFTTAGMQQLSLYLSGEKDVLKDFKTRHLADCQKCFRSDDIDEIGDDTHNTFFEMLGNWSIGQDEKGHYFKEGAVKYALEFLTKELNLDKNKFYITFFKGNKDIPKDKESKKIWQEQGIPEERIKEFGEEDNLWGPVSQTGVCGPTSEIHYDRGEIFGCGEPDCGPNCSRCQRFIEIWNLVFMEYFKNENGNYQKLSQKSVDTGMGFERILAILENKYSAYETDLFLPIIQEIEKLCSKKYENNKKYFRIIADHIRGSVFLTSEGIFPSNTEQGYVLRRILRRTIRYGKILEAGAEFLIPLANKTIEIYKDIYPEVLSKQADILTVIQKEEEKFEKALEVGIKETNIIIVKGDIAGKQAFDLYQNYGFPIEMIEEMAKEHDRKVDKQGFKKALKKHQKISRAGKEKKFGGGGKFSPKFHTATHLLHSALRQILGDRVKQMGSDITAERLRFDFSFDRKLFPEEIKKVEDLVNQKIKQDLEVKKQEMLLKQALKSGALAFFKEKYPEKVFVYSINGFSKEICAGPHVNKTGELGKFKIIKEESSSSGIRRIKAILEK